MSTSDNGTNDGPGPGTEDGLGATADPVAFGQALAGLSKRLARDPAAVGGAMVRLGLGVAQTGAIVTARALGAASSFIVRSKSR